MRILSIKAHRLIVPLKHAFRHSSAEHKHAENIVVEIALEDGTIGWGNSLPRPFVTGESAETVFGVYRKGVSAAVKGEIGDWESAVELLVNDPLVENGFTKNLAARTAMELALLDAFGKHFRHSATDAIRLVYPPLLKPDTQKPVYYCVGISSSTPWKEAIKAVKYRLAGFKSLKLKVGLNDEDDLRKARLMRRMLGRGVDLHADANGAWDLERAIRICRELARYGVSAIEQPLAKGNEAELTELCRQSSLPVMLDESLTSRDEAVKAIKEGWCRIFNIRISKCGGLLRSCELAKLAKENGLRFQLGCQVGETGVLSAAGRAFATAVEGAMYLEGSYDRYLLADNILKGDISVGYGGKARSLEGTGLGVEVDAKAVRRLAVETVSLQ